jgi:beta-glucosidase
MRTGDTNHSRQNTIYNLTVDPVLGIRGRKMRKGLAGVFAVFVFAGSVLSGERTIWAEEKPLYKDPSAAIDERADDLLTRMTLTEKVHQLATMYPNANVRLGIPHLKSAEALHGVTIAHATSFPSPLAMGSTWNPNLIERMGIQVAREARALGVHQVYSPMLGVLVDPRWGRSEESFGEDPYLVSRIGVAYISGLQGLGQERFGPDRIIASPKHFIADGQPPGGLNAGDMDVSEQRLREFFMPPFRAAVMEAQVGSLMPAHHAVNGVPMHSNTYLLVEVLREEWGFDGHIISDNSDIRRLHELKLVAPTRAEAARLALEAGVDQELQIGWEWNRRYYGRHLVEALETGAVPEELVDRAARNVLRSKFALGLFDDGTPIFDWQDHLASGDEGAGPIPDYPEFEWTPNTAAVRGIDESLNEYFNFLHRNGVPRDDWRNVIYDPTNDDLALEVGRSAITLLKNEGGLLPLDREAINTIAVIGPNGDVEILGAYSTPKARHFVTVVDGIRTFLGNDTVVLVEEGVDITRYDGNRPTFDEADIPAAVAAAQRADVVVLAIGGNELTGKENQDSDDISLPGRQRKLVQAIQATGTPTVAVLLQSRPLAIPWVAQNVPAILTGWFLGQETGTVVAEALFGDINPGGKLTVSIPRNTGQIPSTYYRTPTGERSYRDNPIGPLFGFGHGLSYTSFGYSDLEVEPTGPAAATVRFKITNNGERSGDEVVQVYVHDEYSSVVRPLMELKGFERVSVDPGETRTVEILLEKQAFSFYDEGNRMWRVEPGRFELMVGSSSEDIRLRGTLDLPPPKPASPAKF